MLYRLLLFLLIPVLLISCNTSEQSLAKVSSTGHASIEVKPDIATIRFQVLIFNKDATAATKDLALTSLKVVTYFSEQNIPETDVEAHDIEKNIVRRTDESGKPLEILGYEITRSFSVKLTDLKKFETIMQELYAMPNVSQLHTAFESKNKEKQEAELLQKACLQARTEAEQMAKGFGIHLGRVYRISKEPIVELFESADMVGMSSRGATIGMESGGNGEPLFYPPATIKLTQEVYAIFEVHN